MKRVGVQNTEQGKENQGMMLETKCQIIHGFVNLLRSRNLSTKSGGSLKGFKSMSEKASLQESFSEEKAHRLH